MSTKRARSTNLKFRAVRPNAGLRVAYRKKLMELIDRMSKDVAKELTELYSEQESRIAMDAKRKTPAERLQEMIDRLKDRWTAETEKFADETAPWFVKKARGNVDRAQNAAFKDAGVVGFDVRFDKGVVAQDTFDALVNANVSLIKSISSTYLNDVEGIVMRAVTGGHKIAELKKELQHRYGVTSRRADLIARDQNNKATEGLARANDMEIGVEEGEWIHIPGKYSSRESHKKMNGKKFRLDQGMWDEEVGKYIMPGELVACNCTYRPILKRTIWEKAKK